jgi:copper(I)-binding protein
MEVHEMVLHGDVMRMRELEGGLPIPAGETVALQPGGYHVMFMDLAGPFEAGQSVEVTLTFEKAGDLTLTMPVVPRGGAGMGHGGHGGMTHGGN